MVQRSSSAILLVGAVLAIVSQLSLLGVHGLVQPSSSSSTTTRRHFSRQQQERHNVDTVAPLSMTATSLVEPPTSRTLDRRDEGPKTRSQILANKHYLNSDDDEPPTLGQVQKLLPSKVFQVDTATSLFYFGVDLMAVVVTMGFLDLVVTSDNYHSLPMWAQALSVAPLQVLTGFAMWCMWCIGYVLYLKTECCLAVVMLYAL